MTNPYFSQKPSSNKLLEDLTVEAISIYGKSMIYMPRTLVREDKLFGEDPSSAFNDGHQIDMYVDSVDGFGGGDQITNFGFEIQDTADLVVSKKKFNQLIATDTIKHPREGDLIFFPMTNYILEIKFVEHENPFYQLGKLYTYRLSCELFRYSHETLNTGFSDVDGLQSTIDGTTGADQDGTVSILPQDGYGTNTEIGTDAESILDFSEVDPFSEGNYRNYSS